MTRSYLAIPAGSFLLVTLLLPAFAQTNIDNPQTQVQTAAAVAYDQKPKLSDEDLARLYLIRKQFREAQDLFHKLTVEQPKNAVYWNELGISLHNQAELDLALKCYQKSAKLDSHYADAQNNVGTIYYERKKYAKAIRSYKKAILLRQDFAAFYLNMGYAYFGEKNYEDSIAAFREACHWIRTRLSRLGRGPGQWCRIGRSAANERNFIFLLASRSRNPEMWSAASST